MSETDDRIEVVRRTFDAYNRRDWDTMGESYAPRIVVWPPPDWPSAGPFIGVKEVIAEFRTQGEAGATLLRDLRFDTDGNWVVAHFTWSLEGAASGAQAATDTTSLYRVVDGAIAEIRFSWGHLSAEEALGVNTGD